MDIHKDAAQKTMVMQTILIIDDEDFFRQRLAKAFTKRGYKTLTAANFDEAMDVIASEKPAMAVVDPDIRRLQDDLSEKLGAGVQVHHTVKGKGKLIIQYNSLDELEGILAHIK